MPTPTLASAARHSIPAARALLHFQRALELVETHEARVPKLTLSTAELLALTADAAFAADDAGRAAGLAQQAISELAGASAVADAARRGSRAQHTLQLDVGLLYLRLGLYQSAAGDHVAAQSSLQTAVQLVPDQPTAERARVLGALAQVLMLDGSFEESASLAEQARAAATDADPVADAELGHATCTLGVDIAYGGQIDRGLAYLEEAAGHARRAGRLDDLMRTYANRTHLLELDARYDAALAIVQQGIEEARRWEQEAGYGAFLRGNAADILFKLGRWSGSEAECRAALDWSPHRLVWSPLLALGAVLVESRSDDEAGRLVGQILLQLEAVPDGQWTATVQRIAVSYALWRDDVVDAERVARRGWTRVLATGDRAQIAMAASTTTEACAAFAEAGRHRRDIGAVAAGTELATASSLTLSASSSPAACPRTSARPARRISTWRRRARTWRGCATGPTPMPGPRSPPVGRRCTCPTSPPRLAGGRRPRRSWRAIGARRHGRRSWLPGTWRSSCRPGRCCERSGDSRSVVGSSCRTCPPPSHLVRRRPSSRSGRAARRTASMARRSPSGACP